MAPSFSCYKVGIITSLAILIVFLGGSSSADDSRHTKIPCGPDVVFKIVKDVVIDAIKNETRMGASLLRLHFHDCFVKGCDGSILLDDTQTFTGEKTAFPNRNSVRGFLVVDKIKTELEKECPGMVSCADILAIAARDAVQILKGPYWDVTLGRLDSKNASLSAANNGSIPAPSLNISDLVSNFDNVGLSLKDLVALSGAHTVGQARCTSYKNRIYNETNTIDSKFAKQRKEDCPSAPSTTKDNNTAPLDVQTSTTFDNSYYKNLLNKKGLLHSDQQLLNGELKDSMNIVRAYAYNQTLFNDDFIKAMIKMGNIRILKEPDGEIRKNCRVINKQ